MAEVAESNDQDAQRFHFDALVRGLCNSADMSKHVHDVLLAAHHKQLHAAASLEANASSLEQKPLLDTTNVALRLAMLFTQCIIRDMLLAFVMVVVLRLGASA